MTEKTTIKVPKQFGSNKTPYPAEMRTQLWPLCCGAAILSGFKDVGLMTEDELDEQIKGILTTSIADHQVYEGEVMRPKLTFLTLNSSQLQSPKIMKAVKTAGFVQFAVAKPRGGDQGFFVRDLSNSMKLLDINVAA